MNVLLLGTSRSGKSTYGGQLQLRLEARQGTALTERKRPEETRAFDDTVDSLLAGKTVARTPQDTNGQVTLPVRDAGGREIDLVWPEFGGEGFKKHVLLPRALPERWASAVRRADGVLLILRPALDEEPAGVGSSNLVSVKRKDGTDLDSDPTVVVPQADAMYVELLQLILRSRGHPRAKRATLPMAIGLTFWDELAPRFDRPVHALAQHYPLLAAYMQGAWTDSAWKVYGISPQGRELQPDETGVDSEFLQTGPLANGFVTLPDGERNSDLTIPLAWLCEVASEG